MRLFPDDGCDDESVLSDASFRFILPQGVGDDTEDVELYQKGGFHPIHLGDVYDGGRYRIVHKLGPGGFATVWLARNSSLAAWVALKIVVAEKSSVFEEKAVMCHNIIASESDSKQNDGTFVTYTCFFHIEGLNDRHMCLPDSSLAGPSDRLSSDESHHGATFSWPLPRRSHTKQHPFRVRNLDHLDDQGIYSLFGKPQTGSLETESGDIPGPEAPRYIVGYLDFMSSEEHLILDGICLADFDQAFVTSAPPKKTLGTPVGFLAPEVAVGRPASPASDVWALGCAILHIRSGLSPFATLGVDCPEKLIRSMVEYIGDMPPSWGEPLFDDHGMPTTDETRGKPLTGLSTEKKSLRQWIGDIWDQSPTLDHLQTASSPPPLRYDENKPYPQCYDTRFWKPAAISVNNMYMSGYCDEVDEEQAMRLQLQRGLVQCDGLMHGDFGATPLVQRSFGITVENGAMIPALPPTGNWEAVDGT